MANFKKMDERDFEFINEPLTAEEEKEFSDFLKNRKSKIKVKRISKTIIRPKETLALTAQFNRLKLKSMKFSRFFL